MPQNIQQLRVQFNMPLTTPDGPGYLVARDADGLILVCVKQAADKSHARCRHAWYKPSEIVEFKEPNHGSETSATGSRLPA